MCLCQHGTDGKNCDSCLPDHWDRPWRRATAENAWECKRKNLFLNNYYYYQRYPQLNYFLKNVLSIIIHRIISIMSIFQFFKTL